MSHPVTYPGDFDALLKKWEAQRSNDWAEDPGKITFIGDGQCARLVQDLTGVGHTSRWQPGERVIDVAKTLTPGTVIANFIFEYDKMWFPNSHGWHAALFIRGEDFNMANGKPERIWMFDQWTHPTRPKWPSPRPVRNVPLEVAKQRSPADVASEFYVVIVP